MKLTSLLVLLPVLATGALAALVKGIFQTVPRGHQATKTRNGAPVRIKKPLLFWWRRKNFDERTVGQIRIYHPGKPVFKIPIVEEVLIRRVNGQNLNLQTKVMLRDCTIYTIDFFIRFITDDIVAYTYDNEQPRAALRNKAEALLHRHLSLCDYTDMHQIHEIADIVKDQLEEFAKELGIQLKDFGITKSDPSAASERISQMLIQAHMSVEAAEAAARNLGFDNAKAMGPGWGSVVQGVALSSVGVANESAKLAEELEDAGEVLVEANGNGNVVSLPHH